VSEAGVAIETGELATFPPSTGADLSLVTVFFSLVPWWISPNSLDGMGPLEAPPMFIDGGGGGGGGGGGPGIPLLNFTT